MDGQQTMQQAFLAFRRAVETVPYALIAIMARIGIGAVFLRSGQTKVDGFSVTDSTLFLFADEYRVPVLPSDLAAHLAAYGEHVFPVLLFLGLGTRFAALGLLGMTGIIQFFVYPNLWPDHLVWATVLVLLVVRGGGQWSLDHWIVRKRISSYPG